MLWKTCYWVIDGLNIFSWKKIFLYLRGRIRWCCEILFKYIWPYWWYWWIKYYEVNIYLLRSIKKVSKPLLLILSKRNVFKSNLYAMKNLLESYRWAWKKILLYRQERIRWWCEILFKLILPYWRYWWIKYY